MKRIIILLVVASLALSGCASGKFLGFLATSDYVDAQAKATEEKQAAQIAKLQAQLAEYQTVKDQAAAAVAKIQEVEAIAKQAEERIGSIPQEVIRQIVEILQAALQ